MTKHGKFTKREREQMAKVLDSINEWIDYQEAHDTDLFEETDTSAREAAGGLSQLLMWLRMEDESDARKADWLKEGGEW